MKMVDPNYPEEASFGAAPVAGTAAGVFRSLDEGSGLYRGDGVLPGAAPLPRWARYRRGSKIQ
jgi:hypothetical protein